MKTENLYNNKSECCGCELCAQSCPKHVIQMVEDEEGFLYPSIDDENTCINCQKCITVCPNKSPGREKVEIQKSFSFSLKEQLDLKKSASGGLATAISREFIKKGGIVYGVTYTNEYHEVRYVRASREEELEQLRGSKYAQAIKGNIYSLVRKDLKDGKDVLYIGLPCEISALYHAISHIEHLYTISLICHGPTSQKVHRDYLDSLPKNESSLSFFSVRHKLKGWKPYFIHAEYSDGTEYNEQWNHSDYGIAFLYLKRPSCRTCRYKAGDVRFGLQSDMTIGDFHGVNKNSKQYNPWGVSQGSVQSEKGNHLASLVYNADFDTNSISYSHIKQTNCGLFVAIPQRGDKKVFVDDYINHSLHYACHSSMVKRTELFRKLQRYFSKVTAVRKIVKRIFNHFQIR